MTKNLINVVVVASCVSLSVSVQGEVVKGWVRRWSRPSLPDVVAEYEKSSSKSLYASELEIVKRQRECGIDCQCSVACESMPSVLQGRC